MTNESVTFTQFKEALEYMVSIEPEPELLVHEDTYDRLLAPYEKEIQQAEATILAYGNHLSLEGRELMQQVLYELLEAQTTTKAFIVIRSTVNRVWNGVGAWQG